MKRCSYCGQLIEGEAQMLPDCSASGVSPPVYWHADKDQCGTRAKGALLADRSELRAAMQRWRSKQQDA